MSHWLEKYFQIQKSGSTLRTELVAGTTAFMTAAYVVAVNAAILSVAGMPFAAVVVATVLASVVGSLLMALWANAPLVVIPGMGDNAFFVYTLVLVWGFTWQQSLTLTLFAGIIFVGIAFFGGAQFLLRTVPKTMTQAMAAGIGMFIAFVGFKNGGLIVANEGSFVALGDMSDPHVWTTVLTLAVLLPLFLRGVKGNFLIAIVVGTVIGIAFGIVDTSQLQGFSFSFPEYRDVFAAFDFGVLRYTDFWIALFALTMMLVFQNMGAQLGMLPDKTKFTRAFQALSVSVVMTSIFGSSATVSAAESATGIAAGGRTGLMPLVAGLLFIPALFVVPFIQLIPLSAIAPIFIVVGMLLVQNMKDIPMADWSEAIPAYLMLTMMPFTFSIANGLAFGFISYPLIKWIMGRRAEVSPTMYGIAVLFVLYFVLTAL